MQSKTAPGRICHPLASGFFKCSSGRWVLGAGADILTLGESSKESIGTEPKSGGFSLRVEQKRDRIETSVLICQPTDSAEGSRAQE